MRIYGGKPDVCLADCQAVQLVQFKPGVGNLWLTNRMWLFDDGI